MSLIAPAAASIPDSRDNSAGMPDDLGQMLNDRLGNCTCAAFYHARQVWTFEAGGGMTTDLDSDVLALYESACGYNPADPTTDQGGNEQDVLNYLLNTGAQIRGIPGIDKIAAYVEIDQKNFDAIKRTIYECGVAYIGVNLPQSVMDNAGDNSIPWDVGGDTSIAGGHAVILVGYDKNTFTCISWGRRYTLTKAFLATYLEEIYGIIDKSWIMATGKTPFGMTLADLETAMESLKYDAAN